MSWHLVQLTEEAAEAHDRRVHHVDAGVELGWRPYLYRATKDAVAQFACHTEEELERRLRLNGLQVARWREWRDGIRSTRLVPRG